MKNQEVKVQEERKVNPKREKLKVIRVRAKKLRESWAETLEQQGRFEESANVEAMTINSIIIDKFYTDEENKEFHTFYDWKKEGKKVKKGEKAFLIWGRKRKTEQEGPAQVEQGEDTKNAFSFFPLAYLFSNKQVERILNKV